MAQNPDFTKFVFRDVEFQWPRLDTTYRFNHNKGESEQCAPTAQNSAWSISWIVTQQQADDFKAAMKAHYDECAERNRDLPKEFDGIFGMKEKEGVITLTARRNGMKADGNENKAPGVIDIYHEELSDKAIWGGSKGDVRGSAVATKNPQNGLGGISLLLSDVKVVEAVYGGANYEDDFGPAAKKEDKFSSGEGYDAGYNGHMSEDPGAGMDDFRG